MGNSENHSVNYTVFQSVNSIVRNHQSGLVLGTTLAKLNNRI